VRRRSRVFETRRDLQQRGGSRELGQRRCADGVAMRQHDDAAGGETGAPARDRGERDAPLRRVARPRALGHLEALGAELARHPVGERVVGRRARAALGKRAAELEQGVARRRAPGPVRAVAGEPLGRECRPQRRRPVPSAKAATKKARNAGTSAIRYSRESCIRT
jgi:hypothetical protein